MDEYVLIAQDWLSPMNAGIVGLPLSGKTTLLHLLAGAEKSETVQAAARQTSSDAAFITLQLPDPRLALLCKVYKPKKCSPAAVDVAEISQGAPSGSGGSFSLEIKTALKIKGMDLLVHVIDAFSGGCDGCAGVFERIDRFDSELVISDLSIVENRINRLQEASKRPTKTQAEDKKELEVLERLSRFLEEGKPVDLQALEADGAVSPEDRKKLRGFCFMSSLPQLIVVNVSEDDVASPEKFADVERRLPGAVCSCLSIEKEIAELEAGDGAAFMHDLGLRELSRESLFGALCRTAGAISFFTVLGDEVRQWHLEKSATAHAAAARIHTDMARGFIRADIMKFSDFETYKSAKVLKERGLLISAGKDHVVEDGDILSIKFNV